MHPTDTRHLVTARHEAFRAEADDARLAAIARAHAQATKPAAGDRHASLGVVRRLVHRLSPA